MRVTGFFLVAALCFLTTPLQAGEDLHYNQVRLQAQQTESVGNDTMHVTLNTFGEDKDPARLAAAINRDMEWALGLARRHQDVSARTGGYQTYPVYRENILRGWRGQQSLELEGQDTSDLGQLVGQLQEKLQVKAIRFSVSGEKRQLVENRLIGAALDAFKARAAIIGENLRAGGYRIVEININTSEQRPPRPYQARMAAAAVEADTPVAVEAGESDIRVMVNGTIELDTP